MTLIGVDLGRRKDYATVNIFEDHLIQRPVTGQPNTVKIKPMEAPSLLTRVYNLVDMGEMRGVPYPEVARRISVISLHPKISKPYALVVDATGVGIAVIDMLRGDPYRLDPIGVTFTPGRGWRESEVGYNVAKLDLMVNLQLLYETERIRIADGIAHLDEYKEQMKGMTTKINTRGHEIFTEESDETHDDFVMGQAIVLWYAEHAMPANVELPSGEADKVFNPATWGIS